jgi:glycosyltransferase involved in cell wall biosynthesis
MSSIAPPKLSVCVVTYNQENYIRQCLKSLVEQKANFAFEIIVSDDCSTDDTPLVIQEFAQAYPALVKPVVRAANIGAYKNYISAHRLASGEYIAHMDGDDYALPGKLQQQVDYLDSHPACNIVFHRMLILNETKGVTVPDAIDIRNFRSNKFGRADFLRLVTIGMNSSKMYRSNVRDFVGAEFPAIDFFMNVEQVGTGEAAFVSEEPLGVYRSGIGIASAGNGTIILLQKSMLHFAEKYPAQRKDIAVAASVVFAAALKNRNWQRCRMFLAVLAKTFRLGTLGEIWRHRHVIPMLSIPRAAR